MNDTDDDTIYGYEPGSIDGTDDHDEPLRSVDDEPVVVPDGGHPSAPGPEGERREHSRPFGAKLALLSVVLFGIAIGVAGAVSGDLGYLAVPVAALGGAAVARATRAVASEDNVRRAKGSLGVTAGVVVLIAGVAAPPGGSPSLVAAAVGLAATSVGFGALVGIGTDPTEDLRLSVRRSGVALGVGLVLSVVVYTGVLLAPVELVVDSGVLGVGVPAYVAFVSLQVLSVVVIGLTGVAVRILDEWTTGGDEEGLLETWERQGVSLQEIHIGYWIALGIQVLLALVPQFTAFVEWALSLIPVLGPVTRFVLSSGLLHLPLLTVAGLALLVLLARAVQSIVVLWAGHEPPRALSYAAGGVGLSAVTLPLWLSPVGGLIVDALLGGEVAGNTIGVSAGVVGPAALLLGAVGAVLAVAYVGLLVAPLAAGIYKGSEGAANFGAGAMLVFLAGALAVVDGVAAPIAFLGVLGALFVWDLGENAAGLVDQVGSNVDLREAEVTHAAGSLLVGGLGVALATLAYYGLGYVPIRTPEADSGSFLVLVLALVAIVAFANLALRGEREP